MGFGMNRSVLTATNGAKREASYIVSYLYYLCCVNKCSTFEYNFLHQIYYKVWDKLKTVNTKLWSLSNHEAVFWGAKKFSEASSNLHILTLD